MHELTAEGRRIVEDVASRHGVSVETATAMLAAVAAGGGAQAQFNIAELGGMGQWSRGGMTMVGDMFNNGLKARVDALCAELSGLMGSAQVYARSQSQSQSQGRGAGGASFFVADRGAPEWPEALGRPSSTGAQNDLRYAVFPETRRLAISAGGRVTVYDTGDHRIGGVSQQQSGDQSLTFTSQQGLVRIADLPVVGDGDSAAESSRAAAPVPEREAPRPEPGAVPSAGKSGEDDIFGKIERLADLRAKGILSEPEFEAKKSELLARL